MFRKFLLSCLAGSLSLAGLSVQAQRHISHVSAERLIIKLQDSGVRKSASAGSSEAVPDLSLPDGRKLTYVRSMSDGSLVVRLPEGVSSEEAHALVSQLTQEPAVLAAQVDKRLYPALVPNDTQYVNQWHLSEDTAGMRMPAAWDLSTGSSGVVIAVVDSGILSHIDLDAARILPGYDFISDIPTANDGDGRDADPTDPGDAVLANECDVGEPPTDEPSSWHGLSVVGVMAATSDNSNDVAGMDFAARILPVRVLGKCGGFVSDIIDAIRWSAGLSVAGVPDNPTPAKVINLSLAGDGACSAQEQSAINDAVAAGSVVIVAAGNEGMDVANFSPANCANVVTVGAVARDGSIASYTNRGEEVDLVGPGGDGPDPMGRDDVLTLWNLGTTTAGADTLAFIQGTSFTAAEVSAVAALMLSVNGTLDPDTVRDILRATARSFPDSSCNANRCGQGLVDAGAALAGAADPASVVSGSTIGSSNGGGGGGGGGCVALRVADRTDPLLVWLAAAAIIGLRRRNR
ncbi:serine protease [Thiogranum longum]|uniref:Serine protease n=1 Tax=Thiogranum longum TaxID=1537524 RepID=A0A4V6NDA4_9GAMM|nr:S8 family peptidase [Thiogranum longum]TCK17186.1 serine protease [Thiogranum longum]